MALDGISPEYVAEAVKRFIQGHVKRERHAFCPSAPELAIEARRLQTEARVKQAMETRRLPKPEEPVSVISEQERAEMYAKTQKLIEDMKRNMAPPKKGELWNTLAHDKVDKQVDSVADQPIQVSAALISKTQGK